MNNMYKLTKRIIDLLLASSALILLSPLVIPSIIILLVTGEHEVFYFQKRVGYQNKLFNIWKFATMLKNSRSLGTGEITLRGKVLPIGGVKEKLLAAHRFGIDTIILPKDNEKDLVEVPEEVRDSLNVCLVETIDEVLSLSLEDSVPTAAATDEAPPIWTTEQPSQGIQTS